MGTPTPHQPCGIMLPNVVPMIQPNYKVQPLGKLPLMQSILLRLLNKEDLMKPITKIVLTLFIDFLFAIQVTIQLTDHSAIGHIFTIWILDVSGNWMLTVFGSLLHINIGHEKNSTSISGGVSAAKRTVFSLDVVQSLLRRSSNCCPQPEFW